MLFDALLLLWLIALSLTDWVRLFIRIVLLCFASDISDDDTGVRESVSDATSGVDVPVEEVWGCDDESRMVLVEASAFVEFELGVSEVRVSKGPIIVLFSSHSTSSRASSSEDLLREI